MTTVQAVHSYGQPFKHVIDFLLFPKCLLYRFSWFPIVLHLFYLPINLEPLGIIINLQSIIVIYKIYQSLILTASLVKFQSNCCLSKCRGSPTSTISTSTNFIAIGMKLVLVGYPLYCYVVKLVLVEIGYVVLTSTNFEQYDFFKIPKIVLSDR